MAFSKEGNNKKGTPPKDKKYPNAAKPASGSAAPPPPSRHGTHPFSHYYPGRPLPGPPPPGYDPETGHMGSPGPYTAAQYEKARAGMSLPPYGAPPPHAVARSGSGSPPSHMNRGRGRDPPPPHSHYPPHHGGVHPPPGEHQHPPSHPGANNPNAPPATYSQRREEHMPLNWNPGFPRPPFAGGPHQQSYPPPPADHVHQAMGPYRFSDSSLRREAVSRINSTQDRFNPEVDGREGATSPSQIETSHREEVTSMGCTCKKTKCLKLYCQCFAVKIYCGDNCRCLVCKNTPKFEKERKDAIRNILARNPTAFDTKFKKSAGGRVVATRNKTNPELAHKLGCKCRKSACMKKYCECYAGNVKCSANCRCVGCKNQPIGGIPPSAPSGAPMLTTMRVGPVGQSSSEEELEGSPTGKRSEPWMMNAAHNLAFLKHASPQKPKRTQSIESRTDVGSMPSLGSEESSPPLESKHGIKREDPPTLETASSSEKTAVNALLMAAMAMTEMSTKNKTSTPPPHPINVKSEAAEPEEEEYETPQKNLLKKFNSPKRKQSDIEFRNPIGNGEPINGDNSSSPSVGSDEDDSPKRDYPGNNTPHSNQQKVKRSRLGSHKKLPRNLGSEWEHKKLASSVLNGFGDAAAALSTPKTKGQKKDKDLTPVSARCIDFRNMHVNEANAKQYETRN